MYGTLTILLLGHVWHTNHLPAGSRPSCRHRPTAGHPAHHRSSAGAPPEQPYPPGDSHPAHRLRPAESGMEEGGREGGRERGAGREGRGRKGGREGEGGGGRGRKGGMKGGKPFNFAVKLHVEKMFRRSASFLKICTACVSYNV